MHVIFQPLLRQRTVTRCDHKKNVLQNRAWTGTKCGRTIFLALGPSLLERKCALSSLNALILDRKCILLNNMCSQLVDKKTQRQAKQVHCCNLCDSDPPLIISHLLRRYFDFCSSIYIIYMMESHSFSSSFFTLFCIPIPLLFFESKNAPIGS